MLHKKIIKLTQPIIILLLFSFTLIKSTNVKANEINNQSTNSLISKNSLTNNSNNKIIKYHKLKNVRIKEDKKRKVSSFNKNILFSVLIIIILILLKIDLVL